MYDIIGKEIKFPVFYKEFRRDDIVIATHFKYEISKVLQVIDVNSDYKEGWSQYELLMENGRILKYFSPKLL
jgi:hypothetical protein